MAVGYNRQQVELLATAGYGIVNALTEVINQINSELISKVKSEEIFPNSVMKQEMLEAVSQIESTVEDIQNKVKAMTEKINDVNESCSASAKTNLSTMEEAQAMLAQARKNVTQPK